jgi:hypothetical protein
VPPGTVRDRLWRGLVVPVPRATEATLRDALALRWIGEQYTARADVLGVLLGRLSPAELREPGRVGSETVRHHVRRWERLGFAERRWLRGAAWLVPTRRGLMYAGVDWPPYEPNGATLEHTHAVAVVRLAVEAEVSDLEWACERRLRAERQQATVPWWLPDAMVAETTVEVELTRKRDDPLRRAVAGGQHPRARGRVYFTPPADVEWLQARLATIRADVLASARGRWLETQIRQLPQVPGVSYRMPDQPRSLR